MTTRYVPASHEGWLTFVAGDRALMLGGYPDGPAIESAWAALEQGAGAVLDFLASHGLQATPPFALIEPARSEIRVIVRGEVEVVAGTETLAGSGAATWIERVVASGEVSARVLGAREHVLNLPISRGVVWAASLRLVVGVEGAATVGEDTRTAAVPSGTVTSSRSETPAAAPAVAPLPVVVPLEQTLGSTVIAEQTATVDAANPAPVETALTVPPGESDYDYLFGATMFRSVAEAAVRDETADDEAGSLADEPVGGDHDGATMLVSQLPRGRNRQRARGPEALTEDSGGGETSVGAVVVVLPGGTRELLDEPLVLGRAPSVAGVPGGQVPRLVTLAGGEHDISRSHLRIELQGGTVVVTDLNSKNGTRVTLPGVSPVRLRPGEPTPVIVGTVVDVGGVVDLTVDDA